MNYALDKGVKLKLINDTNEINLYLKPINHMYLNLKNLKENMFHSFLMQELY